MMSVIKLNIVMLSVIKLNIVMLSVVMLNVVAPLGCYNNSCKPDTIAYAGYKYAGCVIAKLSYNLIILNSLK
jgi:hypothetical protein